jgi:transposase
MGKARRKFDEQYKREAIRFLEETGRPLREVAEELQVSEQSLWRWRKQYGTGAHEPVSPSEAAELRRLRREVEILRQERDFLKKATAYFANPSPRGTPASGGTKGRSR